MHKSNPDEYSSLESMGIAVISADSDSQVAPLGEYFRSLGKETYAIFDKQTEVDSARIKNCVGHPYESPEKGFELLVIKGTCETALRRYAKKIIEDGIWPEHIEIFSPDTVPLEQLRNKLEKYFKHNKAESSIADCLCMCADDEIPPFILETLKDMKACFPAAFRAYKIQFLRKLQTIFAILLNISA